MKKRWILATLLLFGVGGCADVAPTMPQENPVPGSTMSSGFGPRENDPLKGFTPGAHHDGYDLAAKEGAPIHPSRDGTVVYVGMVEGYGNTVMVKHDDTFTSLYGHAKEIKVKVGDKVTTKSVLATVGNTGRSTGPHLHYELRRNGIAVDPAGFDPATGSLKRARLPEPPKLPPSRFVRAKASGTAKPAAKPLLRIQKVAKKRIKKSLKRQPIPRPIPPGRGAKTLGKTVK